MRTRLVAILFAAALVGLSVTITTSGASAGGVCTSTDGDAPVIHGGGADIPICLSVLEGDAAFAAGSGSEAIGGGVAIAVGRESYAESYGGTTFSAGAYNVVSSGPLAVGVATGASNAVESTKGGIGVARGSSNTIQSTGIATAAGTGNHAEAHFGATSVATAVGSSNYAESWLCTAVAIGHAQSDSCDDS